LLLLQAYGMAFGYFVTGIPFGLGIAFKITLYENG
jgi:hypothetical protein